MTLRQRWKQTAVHNKILAGATLFYAVAAATQVLLMYEASKESTAQVKRVVCAVELAEQHLSMMVTDNRNALKGLQTAQANIEDALRLNREAMKANTRQGKRNLDQSIATARDDSRAWLGVVSATSAREVKEGATMLTWDLNVLNSGRTPALHYSQTGEWGLTQQPFTAGAIETKLARHTVVSQGVIQPGATSIIHQRMNAPLTNIEAESMLSKKATPYAFGVIRYEDVYRRAHWTKFCLYLDIETSTFHPCPVYNDAN